MTQFLYPGSTYVLHTHHLIEQHSQPGASVQTHVPVGDILWSTSVSGSHSRLLASENVGTLISVSWKFCPTTFCAVMGVRKSKMVSTVRWGGASHSDVKALRRLLKDGTLVR